LRSLIRGGQLPRLGGFSAEGDCLGSWWTWIGTARREDCCTHPGGSRAWPPEGFRRSLCGGSQERTRTWGPEPFEGLNISFGNWPLSHVGSRTGFGVARDRRDRLGISTAWRYVVWLCTGWGRSHSAASGAPGNECRRGMMGGMRPREDGWRWAILLGVSVAPERERGRVEARRRRSSVLLHGVPILVPDGREPQIAELLREEGSNSVPHTRLRSTSLWSGIRKP
jgi:hypothetical protein